jgi:hypothetical protein
MVWWAAWQPQVQGAEFGHAAFGRLCYTLAGRSSSDRYNVAGNGTIIERQQLLTTQNLAACVVQLGLQLEWASLAAKAWAWVVHQMDSPPEDFHARLTLRKDTANAVRQIAFYLSQLQVRGGGTPGRQARTHAHLLPP